MAADGEEPQAAADRDPPGHDALAAAIGCVALFLFAFSPWLVDRSGPEPFYKGPLIFPMMVLAMIVAGAIPSIWRIAATRPAGPLRVDGKGFPLRGAFLFATMCLYPSTIAAIGLEAATFLALLLGMLIGGRSLLQSLGIAVLLTALAWIAVRAFLDLWFPQPWLLSTIGV